MRPAVLPRRRLALTESAITAAPIVRPTRPQTVAASRRPRRGLSVAVWLVVAAALIAGAIAIVAATGMRPGYDAFGWLVWGHQILHGALNTDGAPSWKPFTFLFTLPYALAGDNAQMWLWMITSTAGSLAGAVFGARIAYRLTARDGSSRGLRAGRRGCLRRRRRAWAGHLLAPGDDRQLGPDHGHAVPGGDRLSHQRPPPGGVRDARADLAWAGPKRGRSPASMRSGAVSDRHGCASRRSSACC